VRRRGQRGELRWRRAEQGGKESRGASGNNPGQPPAPLRNRRRGGSRSVGRGGGRTSIGRGCHGAGGRVAADFAAGAGAAAVVVSPGFHATAMWG
jgi:hypothetical protein